MRLLNGSFTMLLTVFVTACTPTRVAHHNALNVPGHWHYPERGASAVPLEKWWTAFHDPFLDRLISRALTANHDLKAAKSRIREVTALVTVAQSALYPTLDFSIAGGREKRIDRIVGVPGSQGIELIAPAGDMISGGLNARWEIDLFGGRHLDTEAAMAQAEASKEVMRAVQVSVLARLASHYFEAAGAGQRIKAQQRIIACHKEKLRAILAFHEAGLANEADVDAQRALLRKMEAVLPVLRRGASLSVRSMEMLLGQAPFSLEESFPDASGQGVALPAIPGLLPADLLARRPDLRAAQAEVKSAAAQLGAARAELFPKIVLSASAGLGAIAVGGFPGLAESVYTLGSGLTAPIFNAGRIKAYITAADARLEQAAVRYEKAFLQALSDVENAYVAFSETLAQKESSAQAKAAAEKVHRTRSSLYRKGAGDYLSVLDARAGMYAAEMELSKIETALQVAMVSMYRAFGGGWNSKAE
ncbi:MAG: efflux transporter outer membrane subunit [Gammaproteobacteria bacterium]